MAVSGDLSEQLDTFLGEFSELVTRNKRRCNLALNFLKRPKTEEERQTLTLTLSRYCRWANAAFKRLDPKDQQAVLDFLNAFDILNAPQSMVNADQIRESAAYLRNRQFIKGAQFAGLTVLTAAAIAGHLYTLVGGAMMILASLGLISGAALPMSFPLLLLFGLGSFALFKLCPETCKAYKQHKRLSKVRKGLTAFGMFAEQLSSSQSGQEEVVAFGFTPA